MSRRSREIAEAIRTAKAVHDRVRRDYDPMARRRRRAGRRQRLFRRLRRFAILAVVSLIALFGFSLLWSLIIDPIGILGIVLVLMMVPLVIIGAALFSGERRVAPTTIGQAASLPALAAQADEFLYQQRRALPPPAQDLTDIIAQRLDLMAPQLAAIDQASPDAHELRRLIGEELPDLITKYRRVPANLRHESRNGRVPERELIEGLQLLDAQIDETQRHIAAADMDRLSSHKRYLELRYQGDDSDR